MNLYTCRPFEVIAVATCKGIAIWHVLLDPESNGRPTTEKVALLPGHDGEVYNGLPGCLFMLENVHLLFVSAKVAMQVKV